MHRYLSLLLLSVVGAGLCRALPPLPLAPGTEKILEDIYVGRSDAAIQEAQEMEKESPEHPLGYVLEAEALWWKIWIASAEYKYGMTLARHREKVPGDQHYLELSGKALALAEASLKKRESAEMYFYAGMAEALQARLYGLRWESRATARVAIHARENFTRALALDPSLADAEMGLGLYNYYVDTLSTMARVLRFVMGIPGGSKEEGIRLLQRAIREGQITPVAASFYLAINLHNYDQKYEEALRVLTPLVEKFPENALFLLAQGDLYAKLGRRPQALAAYHEAGVAAEKVSDAAMQKKLKMLVHESVAAVNGGLAGKR
jgi:tetratricopeptide (TPR) repeat protein